MDPAAEWVLLFTNLLAEKGIMTMFLEIIGPSSLAVFPDKSVYGRLKGLLSNRTLVNYEQIIFMRMVLDIVENDDPFNVKESCTEDESRILEHLCCSLRSLSELNDEVGLSVVNVSSRVSDAWFLVHAATIHLDIACSTDLRMLEDGTSQATVDLKDRSILFCVQIVNSVLSRTFSGGKSTLSSMLNLY